MNNFIKQVIEEKFASKAQQRFFYAQAGKGGKKGKKWAKWAKEFSDKTDYEKIPDKVEKEEEVDEIVDGKGNIARGKKYANFASKFITQNKISDEVTLSSAGQMGNHAFGQLGGGRYGVATSVKYWAEGKELTKKDILEVELDNILGADDTILKDLPYDKAKKHLEDELEVPEDSAEEKLDDMGYDKDLPNGQVRLVENPKKFVEEYLESVLKRNQMSMILLKMEKWKLKK